MSIPARRLVLATGNAGKAREIGALLAPAGVEILPQSAFGLDAAGGGLAGALLNGVKRGLFSNEAGMGSAPNIAAVATPDPHHPSSQGFVQALGAGIDPAFGNADGIVGEDRDVFHFSLAQANALPIFEVDGGDQQHASEAVSAWVRARIT